MNHKAIFALYPQVVSVDDGAGAFDKDGKSVEVDTAAVASKALELEEELKQQEAAKQATHDAATAKLKKLGLTDDEISALKGTL